jgi:HEAT repeat protein
VRYYAARSIGRHAFAEAIDALAELANTDEANPVRIAAMEALGSIGGERAVAVLASLADSDNADLARAALNGLGLIDHPDALGPLVARARSQDPARRIAAIEALGKRRSEDAAGELQWIAATDANSAVAQAAIGALAHMATPKAIDAIIGLAAEPSRHQACVAALARLDQREFDLIGRGLSHAHAGVRRAVIEALDRAKHARAGTLERRPRGMSER